MKWLRFQPFCMSEFLVAKKGVSLGQRVEDFEDIELKARPRETRRFACDPRRCLSHMIC